MIVFLTLIPLAQRVMESMVILFLLEYSLNSVPVCSSSVLEANKIELKSYGICPQAGCSQPWNLLPTQKGEAMLHKLKGSYLFCEVLLSSLLREEYK